MLKCTHDKSKIWCVECQKKIYRRFIHKTLEVKSSNVLHLQMPRWRSYIILQRENTVNAATNWYYWVTWSILYWLSWNQLSMRQFTWRANWTESGFNFQTTLKLNLVRVEVIDNVYMIKIKAIRISNLLWVKYAFHVKGL